jgi:hypothetical protein
LRRKIVSEMPGPRPGQKCSGWTVCCCACCYARPSLA